MLLQKGGAKQLVVKDANGVWTEAQGEDYQDLAPAISNLAERFLPAVKKMNQLMGFMSIFKKDFIVFKVKYMKRARHKGARCDQSHKKDAIQIINDLLGETVVPADSTKSRIELCIVEEFLLRSFQSKAKDGKAWFLNPGEAVLVDIEKLSF